MSDEMLNRLGNYFVYHEIRKKFGITFEQFIERVKNGVWEEYRKYLEKVGELN